MCVKKAPVIKQRLFYQRDEILVCTSQYKANTFLLDIVGMPIVKTRKNVTIMNREQILKAVDESGKTVNPSFRCGANYGANFALDNSNEQALIQVLKAVLRVQHGGPFVTGTPLEDYNEAINNAEGLLLKIEANG